MPDLSTAALIVSMVAEGNGILESLLARFRSKPDPEAVKQILDLQSLLFNLQTRLLDLDREKFEALNQIRALQEQAENRRKLIRRDSFYEFVEPVEGYGKGPFCLHCTDDRNRPIGIPVDMNGHFSCSSCHSEGWLPEKEEAHNTKQKNSLEKRLQALSEDEKRILRPCINKRTRAVSLNAFDGVVQGLISAGIVTAPRIIYRHKAVSHEITEAAWEFLNANRQVLAGDCDSWRTDEGTGG